MSINNYNSGRQEVQQRSSSKLSNNNRSSGQSIKKITVENRKESSLEQLEFSASTMSQAFYSYGKFCVCHPWEVIVAFFTLSICAISIGSRRGQLDRTTSSIPCTNIPCPSKVSLTHFSCSPYFVGERIEKGKKLTKVWIWTHNGWTHSETNQ